MAISKLESAILDARADGFLMVLILSEVPRLAWLAYQQEALEEASIELTLVAPPTASVDRALAYLAEVRTQEQLRSLVRNTEGCIERREVMRTAIDSAPSAPDYELSRPGPRPLPFSTIRWNSGVSKLRPSCPSSSTNTLPSPVASGPPQRVSARPA